MKFLVTVAAFGLTALFCGCGGALRGAMPEPGTNSAMLNVAGNWEFTTTGSIMGRAPMTFAGSITQAGTVVSSALQVDSTSCFSGVGALSLSGRFDQGMLSLTSVAVDGQIVTLNGSFDNAGFLGTYKIAGGCANGDEGVVVGTTTPSLASQLSEALIDAAR